MDFVHLHVQSSYSLLSSTVRIGELVEQAKSAKMDSLALTDRNVMYGAIPFYQTCKKHGIKPIMGMLTDIIHEEEAYPLVLLARNEKGYSNLLKISSSIQTKSKQGLPLKWLMGYKEGLIAITPGKEGVIESYLRNDKIEESSEIVQLFKSIFGEASFYLSLQKFADEENEHIPLLQFAQSTNTAVVATHPVLYLNKEDGIAFDVLQALEQGAKLEDDRKSEQHEHYFKSKTEMMEAFQEYPKALQNSEYIAMQCNVHIEFHRRLLPKYPTEQPADELLQQLCIEGFKKRYPDAPSAYKKRLQYELAVIRKMNFSDYFLIVWDFMKYARQQRILTGPGRGSAAGSLAT